MAQGDVIDLTFSSSDDDEGDVMGHRRGYHDDDDGIVSFVRKVPPPNNRKPNAGGGGNSKGGAFGRRSGGGAGRKDAKRSNPSKTSLRKSNNGSATEAGVKIKIKKQKKKKLKDGDEWKKQQQQLRNEKKKGGKFREAKEAFPRLEETGPAGNTYPGGGGNKVVPSVAPAGGGHGVRSLDAHCKRGGEPYRRPSTAVVHLSPSSSSSHEPAPRSQQPHPSHTLHGKRGKKRPRPNPSNSGGGRASSPSIFHLEEEEGRGIVVLHPFSTVASVASWLPSSTLSSTQSTATRNSSAIGSSTTSDEQASSAVDSDFNIGFTRAAGGGGPDKDCGCDVTEVVEDPDDDFPLVMMKGQDLGVLPLVEKKKKEKKKGKKKKKLKEKTNKVEKRKNHATSGTTRDDNNNGEEERDEEGKEFFSPDDSMVDEFGRFLRWRPRNDVGGCGDCKDETGKTSHHPKRDGGCREGNKDSLSNTGKREQRGGDSNDCATQKTTSPPPRYRQHATDETVSRDGDGDGRFCGGSRWAPHHEKKNIPLIDQHVGGGKSKDSYRLTTPAETKSVTDDGAIISNNSSTPVTCDGRSGAERGRSTFSRRSSSLRYNNNANLPHAMDAQLHFAGVGGERGGDRGSEFGFRWKGSGIPSSPSFAAAREPPAWNGAGGVQVAEGGYAPKRQIEPSWPSSSPTKHTEHAHGINPFSMAPPPPPPSRRSHCLRGGKEEGRICRGGTESSESLPERGKNVSFANGKNDSRSGTEQQVMRTSRPPFRMDSSMYDPNTTKGMHDGRRCDSGTIDEQIWGESTQSSPDGDAIGGNGGASAPAGNVRLGSDQDGFCENASHDAGGGDPSVDTHTAPSRETSVANARERGPDASSANAMAAELPRQGVAGRIEELVVDSSSLRTGSTFVTAEEGTNEASTACTESGSTVATGGVSTDNSSGDEGTAYTAKKVAELNRDNDDKEGTSIANALLPFAVKAPLESDGAGPGTEDGKRNDETSGLIPKCLGGGGGGVLNGQEQESTVNGGESSPIVIDESSDESESEGEGGGEDVGEVARVPDPGRAQLLRRLMAARNKKKRAASIDEGLTLKHAKPQPCQQRKFKPRCQPKSAKAGRATALVKRASQSTVATSDDPSHSSKEAVGIDDKETTGPTDPSQERRYVFRGDTQQRFDFDKDYNYNWSREEALNMQERLCRESAARMRAQLEAQRRFLKVKFFSVPVSDVKSLPDNHWQWPDLYSRLGLPPRSSASLVKRQYRRLALLNHPDKSRKPNAVARFHAIKEAYESLSGCHLHSD